MQKKSHNGEYKLATVSCYLNDMAIVHMAEEVAALTALQCRNGKVILVEENRTNESFVSSEGMRTKDTDGGSLYTRQRTPTKCQNLTAGRVDV